MLHFTLCTASGCKHLQSGVQLAAEVAEVVLYFPECWALASLLRHTRVRNGLITPQYACVSSTDDPPLEGSNKLSLLHDERSGESHCKSH